MEPRRCWEIVTWNIRGERNKRRVLAPSLVKALRTAEPLESLSLGDCHHLSIQEVDEYADPDFPPMICHREQCGRVFRGRAIYCSRRCAEADR